VERTTGERLLSDQKIGQIVGAKALKISQEIYENTRVNLAENDDDTLQVNPIVDIYNPQEKEVLLFDDGIQVKGQKAERQPELKQENKSQKPLSDKTSAITTDISLLAPRSLNNYYVGAVCNKASRM